jgi:hypothetical protein
MGKKPPLPPWIEHAAAVRKKLKERGFKPADRVQVCEKCEQYAEEAWSLKGGQGMGGRDLVHCMNCGRSRSWRGQGNPRPVEEPFDLMGFLGLPA